MNTSKKEKQENILVNFLFNIIIPVLILSKFSKPEVEMFGHAFSGLGAFYGLIVALLFPLSYGLYDFIKEKKTNLLSIFGFVSVLLTGIIGLFQFPAEWIAVKEAAVPFVIAICVLISTKTKYPLVKTFIYSEKMLDVERIDTILTEKGNKKKMEKMLNLCSVFLACSFFISSILNFVLAKIIIQSPTGTPEFNAELGKMYGLSYPVIALPCTIIMIFILWYLIHSIKKLTGLTLNESIAEHLREKE